MAPCARSQAPQDLTLGSSFLLLSSLLLGPQAAFRVGHERHGELLSEGFSNWKKTNKTQNKTKQNPKYDQNPSLRFF